MKKIIILLTAILFFTVGCGCSKEEKKEEIKEIPKIDLRLDLKDDIRATADITKNSEMDVVQVHFERKEPGTKVKANLIYYDKDNKEVYQDMIHYTFPDNETDCYLDIPILTEITKLKKDVKLNEKGEYNKSDLETIQLNYKSLVLTISNE